VAIAPAPPVPPAGQGLRSQESLALQARYRRLQDDLIGRGLMRADGGTADAPFTDTMLARNFVRIALFDEYRSDGSRSASGPVMSQLRRWEQPIRMEVRFGATVPAGQQVRDRATIRSFAARLERLSGIPITQVGADGNYVVLVVNEDDRRAMAPELRRIVPGISEGLVRTIIEMPPTLLCLVVAFSEGGSPVYSRAVAVIRGEHPDLLRTACVHEELAQGMGLANDHPLARPSIFNDDEEFALLTEHDELLMRILYDPRLRPGMTATEAAPVAAVIAAELMAGGS
jgi:hypothetical protein